MDLVPAHSVIWLSLVDALHAAIDPIYNATLKREIDKTAIAIAHHDLAIQFDLSSALFARLERNEVALMPQVLKPPHRPRRRLARRPAQRAIPCRSAS